MDDILVAVDEASTHIIKYAHKLKSLEDFTIRLTFDSGMVFIQFQDKGKPFNPLDVTLLNLGVSMENRNAGGLGIHPIKNVMDEIEYHHSMDTANFLTLVRNLSNSRGSKA